MLIIISFSGKPPGKNYWKKTLFTVLEVSVSIYSSELKKIVMITKKRWIAPLVQENMAPNHDCDPKYASRQLTEF